MTDQDDYTPAQFDVEEASEILGIPARTIEEACDHE